MIQLKHKDLLDAGVHFGHLKSKWHPNMAPFIFMKRNGIHVIDLNQTLLQLQKATQELKVLASSGKRILFVATKKQAKRAVEQEAQRVSMPYVTERWLGGTLTNFVTIRRLIRKLIALDKLTKETAYQNMVKKEQLVIAREKAKLGRLLQGIADTTRLPAALVVVDIRREQIAVKEAKRLGITVFALTDTNSDPNQVDYPIPGNDDSSRSIELIIKALADAIKEGLEERESYHEESKQEQTFPKRGKSVVKVTSSEEKVTQPPTYAKSASKATPKSAQLVLKQQALGKEKIARDAEKKIAAQEADANPKNDTAKQPTHKTDTPERTHITKTMVVATPQKTQSQEKATTATVAKEKKIIPQAKPANTSAKPRTKSIVGEKVSKQKESTLITEVDKQEHS